MNIELISFKLCPYVQRSVITLLEKNVDFKITYIDLADPPDWFLKLSPFGKVPLLRVDDTAIFESAVINEYLDEINPPSLHPQDPLAKAHNRSWIEFASDLIGHMYQLMSTEKIDQYEHHLQELSTKFNQLEQQLGNGPFFNGEHFNLIDAAFAPLFKHIFTIHQKHPLALFDNYPKIDAWQKTLLARPSVKSSVVDDYDSIYTDYVINTGSYVSRSFF